MPLNSSGTSLADRLIAFYRHVRLDAVLPQGFAVMNPFASEPRVQATVEAFYRRFCDDSRPRRVLLGINPGRHGGGVTGIPFTDPKRLSADCGLPWDGPASHEPSSVFFYDMIRARGPAADFYSRYLSFPVSPLGYLREKTPGRWVNANYYDDPALLAAATPFITASLDALVTWPVDRSVGFVLGLGPNLQTLSRLNARHRWFDRLVGLAHPRFVLQYRSKDKERYIAHYWAALEGP